MIRCSCCYIQVIFLILISFTFQGLAVAETAEGGSDNYSQSANHSDPSDSYTNISASSSWPSPVLLSMYPDSVLAGGNTFTLTVDGNNFLPESKVLWDIQNRTGSYLSSHQMTAIIPASDIPTPGQHYVRVQNPGVSGGDSNLGIFAVRDNGQSFPLYTKPLNVYLLKAGTGTGSVLVRSLCGGLSTFNITLYSDNSAPFSSYILSLPPWVTDPGITVLDDHRIQVTGGDGNNMITAASTDVSLANISFIGGENGTGYLHCILNSATADDDTAYGSGYTAFPVQVKTLLPFNSTSGQAYPLSRDLNGDNLYEDINGNGRSDSNDIVTFFNQIDKVKSDQPWWVFDFDQNGYINLHDVVTLFQMNL